MANKDKPISFPLSSETVENCPDRSLKTTPLPFKPTLKYHIKSATVQAVISGNQDPLQGLGDSQTLDLVKEEPQNFVACKSSHKNAL